MRVHRHESRAITIRAAQPDQRNPGLQTLFNPTVEGAVTSRIDFSSTCGALEHGVIRFAEAQVDPSGRHG